MNKRLLITDWITLSFGIIAFCVTQLIKTYASALLSNVVFIITFTVVLILFGTAIMLFSYKNNTSTVTISNIAIQLIIGILIALVFCLNTTGIIVFTASDLSVCIALFALFASRFMFSLSIYSKEHKTNKALKSTNKVSFSLHYSKNMSDKPHENYETVGYMILVIGALAIVYVTIESCVSLFK
ncbi:MAG: hypothetical protein IJ433_02075 [Ruminococcus sp.]|nr:hypothetical protein [Ruminococcus sp.]